VIWTGKWVASKFSSQQQLATKESERVGSSSFESRGVSSPLSESNQPPKALPTAQIFSSKVHPCVYHTLLGKPCPNCAEEPDSVSVSTNPEYLPDTWQFQTDGTTAEQLSRLNQDSQNLTNECNLGSHGSPDEEYSAYPTEILDMKVDVRGNNLSGGEFEMILSVISLAQWTFSLTNRFCSVSSPCSSLPSYPSPNCCS